MRAGVYGRQSRGSKKSIKDQINAGHEVVSDQGWELAETFSDAVSASNFGTKVRDDWDRVLGAIEAGALDVLVLWESSRGDRKLTTWSGMLDLCQERGVKIHVTSHERTYDPRHNRDWETLATDGVKSQAEVNLLSSRVRRGVAASARDGRPPAGLAPYGYRRVYDAGSGALLGQEPDPLTAPIVREIVARVAASEPLGRIVADLEERKVAPPRGARWYRQRVREMALNRAYLGERKHKKEWHPGAWPALVDLETFANAGRVLSEPGRAHHGTHSRPGKQKHLLTYLAVCDKDCGGHIGGREAVYNCTKGCVRVKREPVDALVSELVIGRLQSPDLYSSLVQAGDDADEKLSEARGEVEAARQRLDALRLSAAEGTTSLESLAVIEPVLVGKIRDLDATIEAATVPADLAGWVGPEADVRARWEAAPVQAKRTVIRALGLKVRLVPTGQSSYVPITERIAIDWE